MNQLTTPELTQFHRHFVDSIRWRLTENGLEIEGSGIERTPGRPITVTRVWERFGEPINQAAALYGVPVELIVATICTESCGDPNDERREPGYISDEATPHRISLGLMQTLISTARDSLAARGANPAQINRAWLLIPANSIKAGASFIQQQRSTTHYDPVLVAAAYNAGDLYHQTGPQNRFRLRQYPIGTSAHCDRFVKWFNDFWAILPTCNPHPTLSFHKETQTGQENKEESR
jgi:hypothetical protein